MTLPDVGIPAFLLEVGGGAAMTRQQDERQAEFTLNFLKGAGLLAGDAKRPEQPDVVEEYRIVTPSRGGFFYAMAKPGDRLAEGTPIGRVVDAYGDEVEVLLSPVGNAILLGIQDYPVVATGAWVAELGLLARREPADAP
jgi:predicted deacylase